MKSNIYLIDIDDTIFNISRAVCSYYEINPPVFHRTVETPEDWPADVWARCQLSDYLPFFTILMRIGTVVLTSIVTNQSDLIGKSFMMNAAFNMAIPFLPVEEDFNAAAAVDDDVVLITADPESFCRFPGKKAFLGEDFDKFLKDLEPYVH